jgi:hypothetical protein
MRFEFIVDLEIFHKLQGLVQLFRATFVGQVFAIEVLLRDT